MRFGGSERAARTALIILLHSRMGQTSIPKYGVRRMNSLIFGEHSQPVRARTPDFGQLRNHSFGIPIALPFIATRPGRDAPTVGAIPGFQVLLPQGRLFRRPLTGHCASGRSLPRERPLHIRAFLLMVYAEDEYLAPFFLKKNGF
jgi:hypothetical protein